MFINLTPHVIVLQAANGDRFSVPPSGTIARIGSTPGAFCITEGCVGFNGGIALYEPTEWGDPQDLPDPTPGTTYIVSALFAGRVFGRRDVVYPGTGPNDGCVRNEKGHVDAVTRLIFA